MAAVCAVGAEYLYRTLPGSWLSNLWVWVPLQLGIGFAIYKLVTTPGTPLVGALIVWSFAVMGLRVLVSCVILKDVVPLGTWIALGLMIAARVAQSTWR